MHRPTPVIQNRTFDELAIGERAVLQRRLTLEDIRLFAAMSGDANPAHLDEDYARHSRFQQIIAHGMWGGALISTVLGMELPGPGTIYLGQTLRFLAPLVVGDILTVTLEVTQKEPGRHRVKLQCRCTNQDGQTVIEGEAEVIAPTTRVRRERPRLPRVRMIERPHLHRLLEAVAGLPPLKVAVVHPVRPPILRMALEAAAEGLIVPVLVGPEEGIRQAATAAGVELGDWERIATANPRDSAERAVGLARTGAVDALMCVSLPAHEFLSAVLRRDLGLRTARRLSHVMAFDVPSYPRALFITDPAFNIAPTLEEKTEIVRNAIDVAHAVGIAVPRVAILSAVETVNPRIASTLEAAALRDLAAAGAFADAILDGPLDIDSALSPRAVAAEGIASAVAGRADILVAPEIESANMLVKQLIHLADAVGAGVTVGARVPLLLPAPGDDRLTGLASCALARLLAERFATE